MTFQQLSFEDWLSNQRWCNKHHRHNCPCGRKPNPQFHASFESQIIAVMRLYADGRVPVSSQWIAIQLLIEYGIERTERTVRNHLHTMAKKGDVVFHGRLRGWEIKNANLVNFQNVANPRLV